MFTTICVSYSLLSLINQRVCVKGHQNNLHNSITIPPRNRASRFSNSWIRHCVQCKNCDFSKRFNRTWRKKQTNLVTLYFFLLLSIFYAFTSVDLLPFIIKIQILWSVCIYGLKGLIEKLHILHICKDRSYYINNLSIFLNTSKKQYIYICIFH